MSTYLVFSNLRSSIASRIFRPVLDKLRASSFELRHKDDPYLPRSSQLAARSSSRGFTLIELIVVIAIFGIVSSIILANNNKFGGRILLENLSYDVALTIRQAQVYGLAVLYNSASPSNFDAAYGMHFDMTNPVNYLMFADLEGTGAYNSEHAPTEVVESTAIQQGFRVSGLCTTLSGSAETCNTQNGVLDIVFKRPEPDACIGTGAPTMGADGKCNFAIQRARIILDSPRGDQMSVVVESTGQISVQ